MQQPFYASSEINRQGDYRNNKKLIEKIMLDAAQSIVDEFGGDDLAQGVYSEVNENEITIFAFLTDPEIRPISTKKFTEIWRERTGQIPGLESLTFKEDLGGPGGSSKALTIELSHNDTDVLDKAAVELAELLTEFPSTRDISDGSAQGKRQFDFKVSDLGYTLGLTPAEIGRQVRGAFYGSEVLKQQNGRNEVRVLTLLPEEERDSEYFFQNMMIKTPDGTDVMLRDVVNYEAVGYDKNGNQLEGLPFTYTFSGKAIDKSNNASGLIMNDGRFVADVIGDYMVSASLGSSSASRPLKVVGRGVEREVLKVGKGVVSDKHTSDFWVFEGVDGRDYAVTGTWGADGTSFFWDVTDPANIKKIDSVKVDARTVNDVKVSQDGRISVIGREGASDRKNGIIILDVSNPYDVKILSEYTKNLTGGVHNVFIDNDHVYALSGSQRYFVINIEDPTNPIEVGMFEVGKEGQSIHDVWIEDGIAYSSNWRDGVYLVDVGNGIADGSPSNPVAFANYDYATGAHHATFPFKSKSTGKFYTVLGDEIFPDGVDENNPNITAGFLHFVDFSDLDNPVEVAKYELPGQGSHNYWIEDDVLYVAMYGGGVRIVDISGDLLGDLYRQGREIGYIMTGTPNGYIPNATMAWGAQLYKGYVFYSDWNNGLGSSKVSELKPDNSKANQYINKTPIID